MISVKQLDPDQARQKVGPDLGPNCLQKLSGDQEIMQLINVFTVCQDKTNFREENTL